MANDDGHQPTVAEIFFVIQKFSHCEKWWIMAAADWVVTKLPEEREKRNLVAAGALLLEHGHVMWWAGHVTTSDRKLSGPQADTQRQAMGTDFSSMFSQNGPHYVQCPPISHNHWSNLILHQKPLVAQKNVNSTNKLLLLRSKTDTLHVLQDIVK